MKRHPIPAVPFPVKEPNFSLWLRWSDGILRMPGDADCHTSLRAGSQ